MPDEYPTTMEEWAVYIDGLSDLRLRDEAITANTYTFVNMMKGEGYTPPNIVEILYSFASRCWEDGQAPPDGIPGEYTSYPELILSVKDAAGA